MAFPVSPRRGAPRPGLALGVALAVFGAACSTPAAEQRPAAGARGTSAPSVAAVDSAPAATPAAPSATAAATAGDATVTVYKSPTCGCCAKWVEHMQAHGYKVVVHDTEQMTPVKAELGVPEGLASCHTATVGGYVVEGHVPAADVDRLLKERPTVAGIAVPGMPTGSPGMEVPGAPSDRYDVVAFAGGAPARVFASH